jgi:hypothetical protein
VVVLVLVVLTHQLLLHMVADHKEVVAVVELVALTLLYLLL